MEFEKPNLNKRQKKLVDKVQAEIAYCSYCQSYDSEDGDIFWVLGVRTELTELLYRNEVNEKDWAFIFPHLSCPYCGNDSFFEGSDVGVKSRFDEEIDEHIEFVRRKFLKHVKNFEAHLENYPLLGFHHRFGRQIHKEISNRTVPITKIQGKFYRARPAENDEVLNSSKMGQPPTGKPAEGRFNHSGQSHLYLSSTKETSMLEVMGGKPGLIWTQEYFVEKEIDNILDLSFEWSNLSPSSSAFLLSLKLNNTIDRNDRNKENWRPDYFVTRFIMDCAKSSGYNGIKYNSIKDSSQFDLVLFSIDDSNVKPIGNPVIETPRIPEEVPEASIIDF